MTTGWGRGGRSPRSGSGRGLRIAAPFLAALLLGCATKDHPPTRPDPALAVVRLLEPSPGDTVAGQVHLVAQVEGPDPVDTLTFFEGERPVKTRLAPPWETRWSSAEIPESRSAALHVEAIFEGGVRRRSEDTEVWVRLDLPPRVSIRLPGRVYWLNLDSPGRIVAIACDPEDGHLPADAVHWTGDGLLRDLAGEELPVDLLPGGPQTVSAVAEDRWDNRGLASVEVVPFRYHDRASPQDVLFNLEAAIQSLDPDGLLDQCGGEFRFIPCGSASGFASRFAEPAGWNRTEFGSRLRAWMQEPAVCKSVWSWETDRPAVWEEPDGTRAWIRCSEQSFRYRLEPPDPPEVCVGDPPAEAELHESSGAGAGLLFGRSEDGAWSLIQWIECEPRTGLGFGATLEAAGPDPAR